jgi:OOP family OmpA-OmpF porin
MLKSLFLILFLSLSTLISAQVEALELNEKKKIELGKLAREAERQGKYYLALEYYKKLVELDTTNLKNQYHLASLFRYTRNYTEAEKHYQTIARIDPKEYPDPLLYLPWKILHSDLLDPQEYPLSVFYLATMQKCNGKHKEAITNLERFKKLSKTVKDKRFKKLLEAELQGCNLAIALKDSIDKATIVTLGKNVNNPHIDFSPIPITDEKIVFGSLRENNEKYYKITEEEKDTIKLPKRKLYVANKNGDNWEFSGEWEGPFNSEDEDIANGTFSLDKTRFYFSKCAQNWQFKVICKIYYAENKDGQWSEPQLMSEEINMPGFTSSHPTMGRESKKNQEVMYFVSDREKGKGGMDIWYSEYDARKKTFKKPKNAGSAINTVGTEITPFYDIKTKTLYYSTNGKPNIGGLDIYKAQGEGNKWNIPIHTGLPFNSYADDLDFALNPSGKRGFIVSNRIGGQSIYNPTCCDDIYEFTFSKFIEIILKGNVLDKENNQAVEGVGEVNIYIVSNENNRRFLTESIPLQKGNYNLKLKPGMNYEIEVRKDGYFNNSIKLSTKSFVKSDSVSQNIAVEKVPETPIIIPKINYDFGSDKLTADSRNALDTSLVILLEKNPTLKIEVRSHTDNKGSDAFNLKLSQKRAESVVNYLVEKGISRIRLIAKGYGETLPIAPNAKADGSDNPDGRQKNRRTEFKIIGNINPDLISYDESDYEKSDKTENTTESE